MVEKIKENKLFVLLLLAGAVYFFLKWIVPLAAPVLAAILFLTVFGPFLQKLQAKFRIHRQLGALLLVVLGGVLLAMLVWVLSTWAAEGVATLDLRAESIEDDLTRMACRLCGAVEEIFGIEGSHLEAMLVPGIKRVIVYCSEELVPGALTKSLEYAGVLAMWGAFFAAFFISVVLLARDYDEIINRMLDTKEFHVILEVVCGVIRYVAGFIKAQTLIMALIGVLSAIVLGILGVRNGILWGALAGVLDALPFVGTGIVLLPLAMGRVLVGQYVRALLILVLFVACILLREFLEPRLIGRKVGVHPVAVLLSVFRSSISKRIFIVETER
jgi:predicted PurR-regulated permease PerM